MAIDSTGFPIEHFSYYYSLRTEKTRKDYIKVSIAVDTAKQAILGYKITKSRQHDTKHAKPLSELYAMSSIADTIQNLFIVRSDLN
mgnify:CR=1 FL=1